MEWHRFELVRLAIAGILWLCLHGMAIGDSWGPPTTEYWSKNRQYLLKIAWPDGKKLTLYRTTPTGGREELWSRPYVDETWPPLQAYVTDDGKHVVLRDVYHNLGYGKVLVFLGPNGEIVRSYELADLLTQDQILACMHTVSSLWWSEPGWFSLINGEKQFAFVTHFGAVQCFDIATGKRIELDGRKHAEIRTLALNDLLPLLKGEKLSEKAAAAKLCGALRAAEAVSELKKLLANREPTSTRASGLAVLGLLFSGPNYSDAQVAAAEALVSILKTEAVPLIESQLADATPPTRENLLRAIASLDEGLWGIKKGPDSPFLLATWHRLSESQLADVRRFAILAILGRDRAQYVYDRPALLSDADQEIRYSAIRCLVERGDKRAIPLLRTALQDSYSPTQVWAFRGLVKYQPDDILDILHKGATHQDRAIRLESRNELVKRGDKEAIATLLARIAALKNHSHDREGWGTEEMEAEDMCELVAELRLAAAEPALREAYSNTCEKIRRPVCGALAVLGDKNALRQLLQFARSGDALQRSGSIWMLGLRGDSAAIPILRGALDDREPCVREAAKEALTHLEQKPTGANPPRPDRKE